MKTLSPKQQQIYDYIVSFSGLHGYPPSVREIGAAMGLKSPSTVHFHLKGLEEAGMIVKAEGKTRAITLPAAPNHTRARRSRRERSPTRCLWWAVWPPEPPFWPRSALRTI